MRQVAILAGLSIFWAVAVVSLSGGTPQQADPQTRIPCTSTHRGPLQPSPNQVI